MPVNLDTFAVRMDIGDNDDGDDAAVHESDHDSFRRGLRKWNGCCEMRLLNNGTIEWVKDDQVRLVVGRIYIRRLLTIPRDLPFN